MKRTVLFCLAVLLSCVAALHGAELSTNIQARVEALLSQMSLEEKCNLCYGTHAFFIQGLPRLGIPEIACADGPTGVNSMRNVYTNRSPSTSYPANIAWAASFNPEIAHTIGETLGREDRARGIGVHLAPAMNMHRMADCGRNFEYLGEDPLLAGTIATAFVRGLQSQGVMATAKHFMGNNQEWDRHWASSDMDERTMREIYLPAFEKVVKDGGVRAVMCSYNPVNGTQMSENRALLVDVLKKDWGFQGLVMSDWGAVRRVVEPANGGLDLEMNGKYKWADGHLLQAVTNGQVSEATLNDKVRRILSAEIATGFLDRPQFDPHLPLYSAEASRAALQAAREGMVLLKNENLLPLDRSAVRSIAVIGPNAIYNYEVQGGGSAEITAARRIDTMNAMVALAGDKVSVSYAAGDDLAEAAKVARTADVAIVCVGFNYRTESEGRDRMFSLPGNQNQLIEAVAAANPNTLVALNSGGNVDMNPWIDRVKGLVMAWYPGQEGARALVEILFGDVNPSGKLPVSLEKRQEDNPCFNSYWKSSANDGPTNEFCRTRVTYSEGVFMGYRGYDAKNIAPRYPFGFGLSYTTFKFGKAKLSSATFTGDEAMTVTVPVTNTGKRAGAEVVELYVHEATPAVPRPPQELKGFQKVTLEPGATKLVTLQLHRRDFSYWDVATHDWKADPGRFEIRLGDSSRNILATAPVDLR